MPLIKLILKMCFLCLLIIFLNYRLTKKRLVKTKRLALANFKAKWARVISMIKQHPYGTEIAVFF